MWTIKLHQTKIDWVEQILSGFTVSPYEASLPRCCWDKWSFLAGASIFPSICILHCYLGNEGKICWISTSGLPKNGYYIQKRIKCDWCQFSSETVWNFPTLAHAPIIWTIHLADTVPKTLQRNGHFTKHLLFWIISYSRPFKTTASPAGLHHAKESIEFIFNP